VVFAFLFGAGFQTNGAGFQMIGAGFQAGVIKLLPVSKPVLGSKFRKKWLKPLYHYIFTIFPNPRFKTWAMKTNVNITVSTVLVS
jgi:hypothetical protein